MSLHKQEI